MNKEIVDFTSNEVHLSDSTDSSPYTVHGVAIGGGDVTRGSSGITKVWPEKELKPAADSLEGRPLVKDHDNSASGVVGRVTKAGYKDGVGVIYEAELYDKDLAEKISNGLLEVSVRGFHKSVDEMDETEDGEKIVEEISFDNLSIVTKGAAPSNTVTMGEHAELEAAELSLAISELDSEYDSNGSADFDVTDGNVVVDNQESDGQSVILNRVEWPHFDFVVRVYNFNPAERDYTHMVGYQQLEAGSHENVKIECRGNGLSEGVHELQTHVHEMSNVSEEGGEGIGEHSQDANPMVTNFNVTVGNETELESKDSMYQPTDGDMVQWRVNPSMFGKVVHVDTEKNIVMVSIIKEDNGEYIETGYTVTAGYEDIIAKSDSDELAEWQPGDWVQWDSGQGIILEFEEGDESAVVDIYEEDDGEYYSIMEEEEVPVSDISDWDVDEDNIISSPSEDEDEDSEENAYRKVYVNSSQDVDELLHYDNNGLFYFEELGTYEAEKSADVSVEDYVQWHSGRGRVTSIDGRVATVQPYAKNTGIWTPTSYTTEVDVTDLIMWDVPSSIVSEEGYDELSAAMHRPSFDGVRESESWSSLSLSDFTSDSWNDLSQEEKNDIAGHFFVSESGFPPERFSDLKLEVVHESGELDLAGLRAAKSRLGQTSGISGMQSDIEEMINSLATENFDVDWEENAVKSGTVPSRDYSEKDESDYLYEDREDAERRAEEIGCSGSHEMGDKFAPCDTHREMERSLEAYENMEDQEEYEKGYKDGYEKAMHSDPEEYEKAMDDYDDEMSDAYQKGYEDGFEKAMDEEEEPEEDEDEEDEEEMSAYQILSPSELSSSVGSSGYAVSNTMNIEEQLSKLDSPVVVEQSDLAELKEASQSYEELREEQESVSAMKDTLEELRSRTEVLDEVDSALVEELRDSEDPLVVESEHFAELEEENETIKEMYADRLAEELGAFSSDQLMSKFSISELRETFEEEIGSVEEELSPDPKSGDVSEENLSEGEDGEVEELSEDVKAAQEKLRSKIVN